MWYHDNTEAIISMHVKYAPKHLYCTNDAKSTMASQS